MGNTLLILAHQDDECLSTGLYIQSQIKHCRTTHLLTVFGRTYGYGHGDQHEYENEQAYIRSCNTLGLVSTRWLGLKEGEPGSQSYYLVLQALEHTLEVLQPSEVVIHDDQDRNQDHRWLSEVSKIALRPWAFPCVRRVLMCQSPDGLPKITNHYVRGTEKFWNQQVLAVQSYALESREGTHPRSIQNLDAWQHVHGSYCAADRAEPYRTYFSKD